MKKTKQFDKGSSGRIKQLTGTVKLGSEPNEKFVASLMFLKKGHRWMSMLRGTDPSVEKDPSFKHLSKSSISEIKPHSN